MTEAAEQIDALYAQLRRDYGLPRSSQDGKEVIHVQVDYLPGLVAAYRRPHEPIIVPSPAVYLVPAKQTDAEILAQAVGIVFLRSMLAQAVERHDWQRSWYLLSGIQLWELWEMGLGLSEWRDNVVQWAYGDAAQDAIDSGAELPLRYRELCAAHDVWMIAPVSISIPLQCDSSDGSPWHDLMLTSLRHASLDNFQLMPLYQYQQAEKVVNMGRPLHVYTVIDYAVTTYGRERLSDLVAASGQHDSWETLIPSVYGVSLDEFEQGWRQHVDALAQ